MENDVTGQPAASRAPNCATKMSKKLATIGDRSSIPIRGMNDLMVPRIGSVISWITPYIGFEGSNPVQEKMIRMNIATSRT